MGKRSRVKAVATPAPEKVLFDEEKTKPNLRLVKQEKYEPGRQALALQSLRLQPHKESALTAWLPFLFGGLLAFGFAYVNKGQNAKPAGSRPVSGSSNAVYTSPLLETVRNLKASK